MSALPGFGLSLPPVSSSAPQVDSGFINTPVVDISGNDGGGDGGNALATILDHVAGVQEAQNVPTNNAIAANSGASAASGGFTQSLLGQIIIGILVSILVAKLMKKGD